MNIRSAAIPRKCEIPDDAYGVFQIPELNVIIPVYKAYGAPAQQAMVDKENAALIMKWGVGHVIADHAGSKSNNGKGIWNIEELRLDDVAFMVQKKETTCYRCNQLLRVYALSNCYKCDGQVIYPKQATDIFCVCCADAKGTENYMAIFKQTGKIPT